MLRSPVDELDDNALAAQVVSGQEDAMAALFRRYWNEVFGIARRILRRGDEARDVAQRVFMESFQEIKHFDPARGSFKSWLLGKAFTRSLNRFKQLQADVLSRATEADESIPSEGHKRNGDRCGLQGPELSLLILELLAKLEPKERSVVTLIYYCGFTLGQAATELKMTVSAVRHSLTKALKLLRSTLAKTAHPSSAGFNGSEKRRKNAHE